MCVRLGVHACVRARACARACVRARAGSCVHVHVCVHTLGSTFWGSTFGSLESEATGFGSRAQGGGVLCFPSQTPRFKSNERGGPLFFHPRHPIVVVVVVVVVVFVVVVAVVVVVVGCL